MLEKADLLCRDQKWAEAIEVLKPYLLHHPTDAGAHFLLARSYLYLGNLVIAEGEYRTAHHYFVESGRVNPIPRFEDPDYFELITFVDMSKVYFLQLNLMLNLRASREALMERVDQWQKTLDRAREIDAESPDVAQGQELLNHIRDTIQSLPDTPGTEMQPVQS